MNVYWSTWNGTSKTSKEWKRGQPHLMCRTFSIHLFYQVFYKFYCCYLLSVEKTFLKLWCFSSYPIKSPSHHYKFFSQKIPLPLSFCVFRNNKKTWKQQANCITYSRFSMGSGGLVIPQGMVTGPFIYAEPKDYLKILVGFDFGKGGVGGG